MKIDKKIAIVGLGYVGLPLAVEFGICCHYRAQGREKLTYKAVPSFYHRAPAQDDL